ncbi:MAG: hypothetical protein GYB64_04315 [Chloroflexi bacterium]|nr:hypothetical protein [Chloroflexota bacterium]
MTEQPVRKRTRFVRARRNAIIVFVVLLVLAAVFISTTPAVRQDVRPRNIDMWMIYPDDSIRFVTLEYPAEPTVEQRDTVVAEDAAGPLYHEEDDVVSESAIGAEILNAEVAAGPENEDLLYTFYVLDYTLTSAPGGYGVDVTTLNSPYISAQSGGATRAAQFFASPQDVFAEVVVAVAFPDDTTLITQFGDGFLGDGLQPYKQINLQGWLVYYFDVTQITAQSLIRIDYVPGEEPPTELDYRIVDRNR